MLLAVAAAIALPALLDTGPGTKDVGLTGATPAGLTAAVQAQGDAVDTTIRIHHYDTRADGEAAVRDGDIDVLVVDARQLEWRKRADEQLKAVVTGAIQLVAVRDRAEAAGIDPDELLAIVEPVPVTNVELGQVEGRSPDDETAAFIMTMVLFFAISTYGAMVLSGVVEEKSSRTVEVLLARMPARNLLAGKIAGIGLLGLAQIAATAHRRARRRVASPTPSTSPPSAAASSPGRSCGSCSATPSTPPCSAPSDRSRPAPRTHRASPARSRSSSSSASSCPSPRSAAPTPPGRSWSRGSRSPPRSPCPTASPWAPRPGGIRWSPSSSPSRPSPGSSCSAAASTPAPSSTPERRSRSARRGEAHPRRPTPTSRPPASVTGPSAGGATAAGSSAKARRVPLILAVVSLALGGVVFAVTADFVVGVAAGAGSFALAVRAMRAWGRRPPQLDFDPPREREPVGR